MQTTDCRPCRLCRLCRLSTFFLILVFAFTFDSHIFLLQSQISVQLYLGAWYVTVDVLQTLQGNLHLVLYYIHFEITGYPYNVIGSQRCDLFPNHTIFCSKSDWLFCFSVPFSLAEKKDAIQRKRQSDLGINRTAANQSHCKDNQ